MATGILRILGTITGLSEGEETVGPFEFQTTTAVGERRSPLILVPGNNAILIPTSATIAILIPPVGNVATLTLKGIIGDTGVRLHKTFPSVLTFEAGVNSAFQIALGGVATVLAAVIFI